MMQKLVRADILGPARFAPVRDELRRQNIERKKLRRVSVGPQVTLVFENRDTMRFQVEEMCRAEELHDDAKIQHEIDTYNLVLPDDGQLAATLFIEVQSDAALRLTLERLVGLQNHVWLASGDERMQATFDADQFTADKLAAVQYLKFPISATGKQSLSRELRLVIDHPNYQHEARLSDATRAELAKDLD